MPASGYQRDRSATRAMLPAICAPGHLGSRPFGSPCLRERRNSYQRIFPGLVEHAVRANHKSSTLEVLGSAALADVDGFGGVAPSAATAFGPPCG